MAKGVKKTAVVEEEATTKMDAKASILRNEKIYVKPNVRNAGWIKNPKHRAFFMMEGTSKTFMAPLQKNGKIKNVLTMEEKETLESVLQMEDNDLSVYKKEDNYWHTFQVRVTKDGLILDLSDPIDYISYKVLLSHVKTIAPSPSHVRNKATYKFYLENPKDEKVKTSEKMELKTEAYIEFAELSKHKGNMLDFLQVYGEIVPSKRKKLHGLNKDSDIKLVKGTLAELVEEDAEMFLAIYQADDYSDRLLISKAVDAGVITRREAKYFDTGESKPFAISFAEAVKTIGRPDYQEFKNKIEAKLELKK